jgi:hypothetical protein
MVALLCCLALLAGPAVAQAGLPDAVPSGCCHTDPTPSDHGGDHGRAKTAPEAGCAAHCAAACCVAVLPADVAPVGVAVADLVRHDAPVAGVSRAERPPVPPPRARGVS